MSMLEVGIDDDPRLRWKGFDRKSMGADPTTVCQHQMVGQKSVSNVALLPTREAPTIDSQRIASSHAGTVDSPGFNVVSIMKHGVMVVYWRWFFSPGTLRD